MVKSGYFMIFWGDFMMKSAIYIYNIKVIYIYNNNIYNII